MSLGRKSSKTKTISHISFAYNIMRRQDRVANAIRDREKNMSLQPNDKEKFIQGENWFNSGLLLEDASEELRNNINFVNGFNRAKRISFIEQSLYDLGVDFYNSGVLLEDIPETYRNNPTVLRGYSESQQRIKK